MPFKEKGVLVTSSELLFTLFCCFTQSLLGTQKNSKYLQENFFALS